MRVGTAPPERRPSNVGKGGGLGEKEGEENDAAKGRASVKAREVWTAPPKPLKQKVVLDLQSTESIAEQLGNKALRYATPRPPHRPPPPPADPPAVPRPAPPRPPPTAPPRRGDRRWPPSHARGSERHSVTHILAARAPGGAGAGATLGPRPPGPVGRRTARRGG